MLKMIFKANCDDMKQICWLKLGKAYVRKLLKSAKHFLNNLVAWNVFVT